MSLQKTRVRFAPSPTGGLHLGGVRTVLYNYLFAHQTGGDFVLRIEDTDQTRFVEGAEEYIFDCLEWCGLVPDESVMKPGIHGPYRQSERKEIYRRYAENLLAEGKAYYAFDTPEELEAMRENLKAKGSHSLQYDHRVRMQMKNSLTLSAAETEKKLADGDKYVIRIKIDPTQKLQFTDLIRGQIDLDYENVDDKVLLKADGMPTYHLAVVVDDFLMKITHAFRGEEWLPSAPIHIQLWKDLFGLGNMPQWAHLPLILKPDGNGKLSKRDGERLGFPVYAMEWKDPATGVLSQGFKELGFLPEAFINLLAVLGWNDGSEQEIYSLEELIQKFSLDRVHQAGAKFNFEKAKWYNHEWIKKLPASHYSSTAKEIFSKHGIQIHDENYFISVLEMVKDRCHLLPDFVEQARFFFQTPETIDAAAIQPKWSDTKTEFFTTFSQMLEGETTSNAADLESRFKDLATQKNLKPGEVLLPLRIMLVGGKYGPAVFDIAEKIGIPETIKRIQSGLQQLN